MFENLNNDYKLISPKSIEKFVDENEIAEDIIVAMDSQLNQYFPMQGFLLKFLTGLTGPVKLNCY